MMRIRITSTLFIMAIFYGLSPSCAAARTWQEGIAQELPASSEVDDQGDLITLERMGYRYFLPSGYDPSEQYPLVLFLHGAGGSGTDNESHVNSSGMVNIIDQVDTKSPAILVAPQLSISSGWSPNNPLDRTDEILSKIMSDYSVDNNRLYVTGLSMGGFGTMNYLEYFNVENPEILRFAAAAPSVGARIATSSVDVLQETPIWLSHGSSDSVVNVSNSLDTFNSLAGKVEGTPFEPNLSEGLRSSPFIEGLPIGWPTAEVGNVRYTQFTNEPHGIWRRFFAADEPVEWLLSKSLAVPEPTSLLLMLGFSGCLSTSRRIPKNRLKNH